MRCAGSNRCGVLCAAAALACMACEAPPPDARWGAVALASGDLVLVQGTENQVVAYDVAERRSVWVRPAPGRSRTPRRCPPRVATNGAIYLSFDEQVIRVDPRSGSVRWEHPASTRRICPAVAPDSGLIVAVGATRGAEETGVVKLGPDGEEIWRYELPVNAGILTNDIRVRASTGDVVLRTTTRLISLNPAGAVNAETLLEGSLASQ